MTGFLDRTGQVFGRLTVKEVVKKGRNTVWRCQCECGTVVTVEVSSLRQGTTKSCGCLQRETIAKLTYRHGKASNPGPTYTTWKTMRRRCLTPTNAMYRYYGGRGITVCERWNDFANFLADMGEKPPGLTIERLDNDRGYEPANCIWTDTRTQNRNKRTIRHITVCGTRMLVRDACAAYGISPGPLWAYRRYHGLTFTEAFYNYLEKKLSQDQAG